MARTLKFKTTNKKTFELTPKKVSRAKVYGWVEKKVLDKKGKECDTAYLDPSFGVIIPKGSIGLGTLSEDGKWISKKQLIAVDEKGKKLEIIPSSFDEEIVLEKKSTIENFLDHPIKYTYLLSGEGIEDFVEYIGEDIFEFNFNYRADYEGNPAFVIAKDENIFVLVGPKLEFEYLEHDTIHEEPEEEDDESNEMDFSMM